MMDFASLKSVEKANTKVGSKRGQNWSFRFKQSDTANGHKSAFYVSDTLWDQLGLDDRGMKQFNNLDENGNTTEVYLGVVSNDDAVFLKRTNKLKEGSSKGRNFKAVILEDALEAVGLINKEDYENQMLSLTHSGEQDGVDYYLVGAGEGTVGLDHITGASEANSDEEAEDQGSQEAESEPTAEVETEVEADENF